MGTPQWSGASVSFREQRWEISEGQSLSIGRQSSCDVQVGARSPGPEDLGVSRRAATVSSALGRIWFRNDSTSQPVFIRPAVGKGYVLDHRGDMISLGDARVELVLEGQIMAYRLTVQLPGGTPTPDHEEPLTLSPATRGQLPFTERQRRLVAALCEPLLIGTGWDRRPASYRQIAEVLGLSEHYVRNQLDELRESLVDMGIPGMIGPEAKDNLAYYAVRSASVTVADVAVLREAGGGGG